MPVIAAREEETMKELIDAIADMVEENVYALTRQYLEAGRPPKEIFAAYQETMVEIGRRFGAGIYFIPELIMSGEMMQTGAEIIKPYLGSEEGARPPTGSENFCSRPSKETFTISVKISSAC